MLRVLCLMAIVMAVTIEQCSSAPSRTDQQELVSELKELLQERHNHEEGKHEHGDHDEHEHEHHDKHKLEDELDLPEGTYVINHYTNADGETGVEGYIVGANRSLEMGVNGVDQVNDLLRNGNLQRGLTQAQKNRIVEYHNELRRKEGAANMETLRWSDRLAQLAQDWANRCHWGHRPTNSYKPKDYGVPSVGENIWSHSDDKKKIPDDVIDDWFNEKKYWDFNSGRCSKEPCGHYTTVVCPIMTQVGCGFNKCGRFTSNTFESGLYMVCNYGPWGKEQPIYKKGTPCSECDRGQFFCTKKLCDSTCSSSGSGKCECKATCKNGGTQTSDCKCKCKSGFSGPACSDRCEDHDRQCGPPPGQMGWPKSWCTDKNVFGGMMYDKVRKQCPKMCGLCNARSYAEDAKDLNDNMLEFLIEEFDHE